jgi:tetratricopeptide (TPR) repeat protein
MITAETVLQRARDQPIDDPVLAADIDDTLIEVLTLTGQVDRAFQVGGVLFARLESLGAGPTATAQVHLRLGWAATAAGDWATAAAHLRQARALNPDAEAAVRARIEALTARGALGQGDLDTATTHARSALMMAEQNGLAEAECEALEILGRRARQRDLAEAESLFEKALVVAEGHGLELWRVRALHNLGTVDQLARRNSDHAIQARAAALRIGAFSIAAAAELTVANMCSGDVALFGEGLDAARRCVDTCRRLRLATYPIALVVQGELQAYLGQRAEMEASLSEAMALAPDDLNVCGVAHGEVLGHYWLLHEDRALALMELGRGMVFMRQSPATYPSPFDRILGIAVHAGGSRCRLREGRGPRVQRRRAGHHAGLSAIRRGGAGRPHGSRGGCRLRSGDRDRGNGGHASQRPVRRTGVAIGGRGGHARWLG